MSKPHRIYRYQNAEMWPLAESDVAIENDLHMKDYLRQTTFIAGVTIWICGFASCGTHVVVPDIQTEESSPSIFLDSICNQSSVRVLDEPQWAMEYVRCHCFDTDAGM